MSQFLMADVILITESMDGLRDTLWSSIPGQLQDSEASGVIVSSLEGGWMLARPSFKREAEFSFPEGYDMSVYVRKNVWQWDDDP